MRTNWRRWCALIAIMGLCTWPTGCTREPMMDTTVPTPDGTVVGSAMIAPTPTAQVAVLATDTMAVDTPTLPPASPTATLPPATATLTLTPTPLPSPTEVVTTTATATLMPTAPIRLVQTMYCSTEGVQIAGLVVMDHVIEFTGTASIGNFWYYKLEYKGDQEVDWHFIGQVETPIEAGSLYTWDATLLAPGSYDVNLIVVDKTGNYPPPCQIEIEITD